MRFGVATTVLLATGALLVAACGGDAGSTSDGPPAAPPAPEQTEPETPQEIDQAPAGGRTGAEPVGDAGSTSDDPPAAPPAREQTEPETPQEIDQAPAGCRTGAEPVGDAGSTSDDPPAAPPAPEQPEPETPQEIDQAPAGCRTGAEPVGDGSAPVPDAQEGRRGGVGVITTVAGLVPQGPQGDGGPATAARLDFPVGVALDGAGNLFIADASNGRVRRVDTVTGIITTVAGTGEQGFGGDGGPATAAQLAGPVGVALDGAGNLFIADSDNSRVRRVDAATGVITTVAGGGEGGFRGDGGPATAARLWSPSGVTLDGAGNLFIADWSNHRVRRVDAASGVITTVAGTGADGSQVSDGDGGPATAALLAFPESVALDGAGNLFIADTRNHRVRRVDAATGVITAVAGTIGAGFGGDGGPATAALLAFPRGVALDGAGNLFIADSSNDRVRRVDAASGVITTVAGTGKDGSQVSDGDGGPATAALLASPESVALDGAGNLFIADLGNSRVRRVDAATGVITTVAGAGAAGFGGDGGPATAALLAFPNGVALDGAGNLFIADSSNDRVRRVDAATGVITTVAGTGVEGFSGDGGPATAARLWGPRGVALDEAGDLFIADTRNHRVRQVDAATGVITTVAGTGEFGFGGDGGPATAARLWSPTGVALDGAGNLFIADSNNHRVRRVDAATGVITTVAGTGETGSSGDGGPATAARLWSPSGVALDGAGNLFIADFRNARVRRVDATTGVITTVAGTGETGSGGDGGPATAARLWSPSGVALDGAGNLFIADTGNRRIGRVEGVAVPVTNWPGIGPGR